MVARAADRTDALPATSLCEGPNMGIYASRHSRMLLPTGSPKALGQPNSLSNGNSPLRVRIRSGPLAGLVCDVVSKEDDHHWLLQPQWSGVFLRVDPGILEPAGSA
jgi:hypothetical protein